MVLKLAGERAIKESMKKYTAAMKEISQKLPVSEAELATAHAAAYEEALNLFYKEAKIDKGQPLDR
jgi:hypothetical protein